MITSIEQARQVQRRRVAAGKKGWSKAVRTFLLKASKRKNALGGISVDFTEYQKLKNSLPHIEPGKTEEGPETDPDLFSELEVPQS